jgi:hypothetical protein
MPSKPILGRGNDDKKNQDRFILQANFVAIDYDPGATKVITRKIA